MITKWIWPIILCFQGIMAMAQVGINQDGSLPDSSALLDVKSLNKGFLLPRMTYMQMISIPSPAEGLMVYDLTHHQPAFFNGSIWVSLTGDTLSLTPGMPMDGGIISYVDSSGVRGFIAAPFDQSEGIHHGSYVYISELEGIGTGHLNTRNNTLYGWAPIHDSATANRICYFLTLNGYNDWFLPSLDELRLLYTNLKAKGIGNFANEDYWSSSSQYLNDCWGAEYINFSNGHANAKVNYFQSRVRAIRSFGLFGMPDATTELATIHSNSTILRGTVNAHGYPTQVYFEYGPTTAYGNIINANQPVLNDHSTWPVEATIERLTFGNTYHYRVVTVNEAGTSYGADEAFVSYYGTGENYGGGIIVYVDSTYIHGLVSSEIIYDVPLWGCDGINLAGASGTEIGCGLQNTLDILAACSETGIPAKICYDLVLNGYDDWFLPSKNEVNCIYDVLYEPNGIVHLYSSSEIDEFTVWGRLWGTGTYAGPMTTLLKNPFITITSCKFRAVRNY